MSRMMNNQQLFAVLDQMPGFFYLQSMDYSIQFANRFFRERFGDPEDKPCYRVYNKGDQPCKKCRTFKVFDTKSPQKWEWTSADRHTYQIYDYPFTESDGTFQVLKLGIDITERKKMEEDLLKTRKLESIALLAGGIAHDFNNLLTTILGNISLARMYIMRGDMSAERLREAEKACLRAKDLTSKLIVFAKGSDMARKTISIKALLREVADFALEGSNCKCKFLFSAGLYEVEVDNTQITSAIHGIITNACEAMPTGGIIDISARNIQIAEDDPLSLVPGAYVKIRIQDHGAGIEEKHLHYIFDPYFTTQKMDYRKGVGLGLAICYSIIKNHGGHISVESEKNKGTTFYIYLPAAQDKSTGEESTND